MWDKHSCDCDMFYTQKLTSKFSDSDKKCWLFDIIYMLLWYGGSKLAYKFGTFALDFVPSYDQSGERVP